MRALIVITFAGLALLAAGCSGSDDASPTTEPAATDAPTITTAPTTTTSTSTTSTTSTSPAPTSTVDPAAQLIADIEADLNAGEQAFLTAAAAPDDLALSAELQRFFSGDALASLTQFIGGLAEDGLLVRSNPDVPSVVVVYSLDSVDDISNPTVAQVTVCRVDSGVVFEPLASGAEAIVNDEVNNTVARSSVAFVAGDWRLGGGEALESRPGVTTCDR